MFNLEKMTTGERIILISCLELYIGKAKKSVKFCSDTKFTDLEGAWCYRLETAQDMLQEFKTSIQESVT